MTRFLILILTLLVLVAPLASGAISLTNTNVHMLQRDTNGRTVDRNMLGSANLWEAIGFNGSGVLTSITINEMLTNGSPAITSAMLTDGTIANADINASAAIDHSKLAAMVQNTIIGRYTASTGIPQAITIGSDFSLSGGILALANAYQGLDADLTDLADGSLTGSKVGTGISATNITTGTYAAPVLSGIGTVGGTWVDTPTSITGLAVNWAVANNTHTAATSFTITLTGTPTSGQWCGFTVVNTGVAQITVTLPAGIVKGTGNSTASSFTVMAASGGNNGMRKVYFERVGVTTVLHEGGGGGSGFPLTADADFAGFDATGIGDLSATNISGDGSLITNLSGTALPSFIPARDYGKITTAEALEYEPTSITATTGATTTIDTTKSYSVVTLNETTETLAFSSTPAEGTPLLVRLVAHTSDCTVTVPSVYSFGTGSNRTTFKVRANKPALWQLWRSNGAWFSYEPVELIDLTANASPTTAYLVETSDPSTGASGKSTLAEVKTGMVLGTSNSGTFGTPTTTNPLSVTWTGEFHAVYYGATGELDLPAAASYTGRGLAIYNTGAFTITVDPNASEVIVRDGTAQTGGVSFTLSSGAGNFVNLISDGQRWITLGFKGTLSVGS